MTAQLVLPRRLAAQALERGQRVREIPVSHGGRSERKAPGVWIDELVSQAKAIMLCFHCHDKFDHKRAGYYKDGRFPFVWSQCDDCRRHGIQAKLYIHESTLAGPGGKVRNGTVWTPR